MIHHLSTYTTKFEAARAFYDREGFQQLRTRRGYYENGQINGIEMRLALSLNGGAA